MNNYFRIVASIEARMTSSRLPGKVLMEASGKPMLEIMIERVKRSQMIHDLVIATTTNSDDDPIIELCNKMKVKYHRGSEPDVLKRVLDAHRMMGSDIIVELTGDCPLMDPKVIDKTIKLFLEGQPILDCAVSVQVPKRLIPDGMDVEVFRFRDLEEIEKKISDPYVREHVSPYFYQSGKYKFESLKLPEAWIRPYFLRITLDTIDDYKLIKTAHESLSAKNIDYNLEDILLFFDKHSELIPKFKSED
jgi:spore coat polysaccharide biosynthesis protein SpsF